jgi:putative ABC transport system permease protein
VTGIVFGLVPAFRLARPDGRRAARGEPRARTSASAARLQSTIAVAEVALAVTLLVGAGVLLLGLYRLHTIDPGFRGDHVLTAELSIRSQAGPARPTTRRVLRRRCSPSSRPSQAYAQPRP